MSERELALERVVNALRREFEYARSSESSGSEPRRTRTARTYDDSSYPLEPQGRVGIVFGTAAAGTSTTLDLASDASAIQNEYQNRMVRLTGGTGKGQLKSITNYVGSSKRVDIAGDTFSPVPDTTTKYSIEIHYPIIFLDGDEDDRQVASRRTATNLGSRYLPVGMRITVVEIEGQWYALEDDGESVIIVPRTEITAAQRTVRAGTDKFVPGEGTGFVLQYDDTLGELVQLLDANGDGVWKRVRNLRETAYQPNSAQNFQMQSPGDEFLLQAGGMFELQASAASGDIIGPSTAVMLAEVDRAGDVVLGDDASEEASGTVKMVKAASIVPKLSGSTPGTLANVVVWEFTNGDIAATLVTITVYNWMDYDIPANELFIVRQESASGRWLVDTDGEHTIEGFTPGTDGQETLYPYETMVIFGEVDESPPQLGKIIDVLITKAAGSVKVRIGSAGDIFEFVDEQDTPITEEVALGETMSLVSHSEPTLGGIDATMTTRFSEWRLTASTITLWHGKVLQVTVASPSSDSEPIFPLDTLEFKGSGGATVDVSRVAGPPGTVTVDVTAGNDGKVKVRTTDNFDFLEDQFLDWIGDADAARYVAGTDPLVLFQTDPIVATTEELRAFIDASALTGYDAVNEVHLALVADVLQWKVPAANDGKVKVRTTDNLDFLEVQFVNWIADADADRYKSAEDPVIEIQTEGAATAEQLRLFINSSDITGYSASGEVHLSLDDNVLKWIAPGASDGRVKVRSTDVLGYLETQFIDWITDGDGDRYASAQDLLVEFQTDPTAATTEQLRGFINSSDITDYSASGELHLALDDNVLKWITPSAGTTWDITDGTITQTIAAGNTLTVTATVPVGTAAPAAADRGLVATVSAVDTLTLSIDETVLQEILVSGTGTNALTTNVEDGVRNQIEFVSSKASTTTEANGADGWVQVDGNATLGTVEFKLHQLDSGKTRVRSADGLDFLEDQFVDYIIDADGDRFDSLFDPVIELQRDDVGPGDDQLKLFINSSDISGYSGSVEQHLTIDGAGGLKWKAPSAGTTWIIAGDTGSETISSGNTLSALGGNGIGTAVTVTDTLTISIDSSVLQSFTMTGTATGGADPILVSAGVANQIDLIANGASSTTRETGDDGWIELLGGVGSLEFKLHEGRYMKWTVDADTGSSQEIVDGETLLIEGSGLTAAAAAADRGVTTVVSVANTVTISVDQSVHQQTVLVGAGTDAATILNLDGTRNTLTVRSGGAATTVQEAGATGWVELRSLNPGELELVLHEQSAAAGGSFTVLPDKLPSQAIAAGDTLKLEGSNLTASPAASKRGIVTSGVNFDQIEFSVDESVHQETALTGDFTGTTPVLIASHITRNTLGLHTDKTNTVTEVSAAKGWVELVGNGTGRVELKLHERRLYEFTVAADSGIPQTIADTDQLKLIGSNLQSAAAQADRGIVTEMVAADICEFSVDETVHQKTALLGTGTTGTTPVLVGAGTSPRNTLTLVSDKTTTVDSTEGSPTGSKGWIELAGDASNGEIEVILHEQTSTFSFLIDADSGIAETVNDSNTVLFEGSGGAAAVSPPDRGIATKVAAVDRIEFSVDATVHQKTTMVGSGTDASTVLISGGTRNVLTLRSNGCSSSVLETGTVGWVQIQDTATAGEVEFILHEPRKYKWTLNGDTGVAQVINDTNTVLVQGSSLAAAGLAADRGVTTVIGATDVLTVSIDQTVCTEVLLSGTAATAPLTIDIEDGVRNQLGLKSNKTSTVEETTESQGYIELKGGAGEVELILHEVPQLPAGAFILGYKAPVLSGGKRYLDNGSGGADLRWALANGSSNVTPGSGIDLQDYFVRGKDSDTLAANNTAFGRSETSSTTDSDEVTVAVDAHPDHKHELLPNVCHGDVSGTTHFDFSTSTGQFTGIQVQNAGGGALTLDHTVTIANNSATPDANIEMLPAFKKLHWFERVA